MTSHTDQPAYSERQADAAQEWLIRLASGEANGETLAAFRQWQDGDPGNRAAFEHVKALWQDVEMLRDDFAADETTARLGVPTAEIQAETAPRRRTFAMAAAAMLCAMTVLVVLNSGYLDWLQADYRTAAGQLKTVTLPDGSRALLNTDTALEVHYTETERRVRLVGGEVELQVVSAPDRPFRVAAANGTSEATGTAYIVRNTDEHVVVTVTEGKVRVNAIEDSSTLGTARDLRQREQVFYDDIGRISEPRQVDLDVVGAWRHGRLIFDDLTFAEAIAELDRYHPGLIINLTAHELEPVSGVFSVDKLDEALVALAATQGLRVVRITDALIVIH